MRTDRSQFALRTVAIAGFALAAVFIFVVGPLAGAGDGPEVYWATGITFVANGAAALIAMIVLRSRRSD